MRPNFPSVCSHIVHKRRLPFEDDYDDGDDDDEDEEEEEEEEEELEEEEVETKRRRIGRQTICPRLFIRHNRWPKTIERPRPPEGRGRISVNTSVIRQKPHTQRYRSHPPPLPVSFCGVDT